MPEINLTTLHVTYMYIRVPIISTLKISFAFFFLDSKLLGYAALNLDHKLPYQYCKLAFQSTVFTDYFFFHYKRNQIYRYMYNLIEPFSCMICIN